MINTLQKAIFKHGYLLIIAAWLFTISFVLTNYLTYDSSPAKAKDKLEAKIIATENRVQKLVSDTALLQNLLCDTATDKKLTIIHEPFGLYLYKLNDMGNPVLSYWNSNTYTISPEELLQKDDYYYAVNQNGKQEIIKQSLTLKGKKVILMAVIPIEWKYFIDNKYLHNEFDGFPELSERYEISNDRGAIPIANSKKDVLFKINQKQGHIYAAYDLVTIFLRLVFVLMLIMFTNRVANDLAAKHGIKIATILFVLLIVLFRAGTYFYPFPFDYSRLGLFDPSVYASNFLHPSLGHLFINSFLLFWIVSFWKFNSLRYVASSFYKKYQIARYANIVLLLFIAFGMTNIVSTMVLDSKISFDVTHFFSLNYFSVISFVTLAFLGITFYHLSHILLRPVFRLHTPLYLQLIVTAIVGLLYSSSSINTNSSLNVWVLIWVVIYLFIINKSKRDIVLSIQKSPLFLFWIMFFALSITLLISWQNQSVSLAQRKKLAERLVLQSVTNGESVLSIAVSNINTKILEDNYQRLLTDKSNKDIKDSILNENFTGYLNRFETNIYTFNQFYQPLFNEDTVYNYASLNAIISLRGKQTDIPNLYSWENSPDQLSYIYSLAIGDPGKPYGYMFLVIRPKMYKSEALYPVLFSQPGEEESFNEQSQFAEALYVNGMLATKYNDYDFPLRIEKAKILPYDYVKKTNSGTEELWYNGGNGKMAVVAQANNRFLEVLTLFAYLFLTFLVVIGAFHLGDFLLKVKIRSLTLRNAFRLTMQAQILATVISISIFSFIVIGTATILYFTNRFNETNQKRLSTSIGIIANEVSARLSQVRPEKLLNDSISATTVGFVNDFERQIAEVSETHNVDINFYSLSGNLIASTQPHIYSKQLLDTRINPTAYYHLQYDGRSRFVQKENIGSLQYLSMYMPVLDDAGKVFAYINIPYLNSQLELNQEISSFIATIINLNAFIFLLAGAFSFLITERVVASFGIITSKMREVNIGKKNEIIVWEKQDEIGELVNEYNKMVQKLEESADALARSEREGAWREMAKQVAHEIKNPLTPMKLSIQYLQRAIDNDMPNAKELSQRVADTLITQIDQLAKIASDFSQFANIDNANIEKADISKKIEGIVQLYKQTESVVIDYKKYPPVYVMGDKVQLSRLFTNLVKNAIESVEEGICHVEIKQMITDNYVTITIKDNGKGIEPEIAAHIFQPNFTTKTSGTGLGLAISKGIVEKLKGNIVFQTDVGKGTTFIVRLPIISS